MSQVPTKRRRRWFQFSLRTLLILVAVGLLVAWRMYIEPYRQQRETMKLIKELGGKYETEPGGSGWIRQWFGAGNFQNITLVELEHRDAPKALLEQVTALPFLRCLAVRGQEFGDEHLARLKGIGTLRRLVLRGTNVSDSGLAHLKELKRLQELHLIHTEANDSNLSHLRGLTELQELYLVATRVSDSGLSHFKGLAKLRKLYLFETQVTDAGVDDLLEALPNCDVHYD